MQRSIATCLAAAMGAAPAEVPLPARETGVVRGPATLLYGSNAVGGLVDVITPHESYRESLLEGTRAQLPLRRLRRVTNALYRNHTALIEDPAPEMGCGVRVNYAVRFH